MAQRKIYILLLVILSITFLQSLITGCEKESPKEVGPPAENIEYNLGVFPEIIYVGESGKGVMQLSVDPPAAINWEISSVPSWLIINEMSGTTNESTPTEIIFEILEETGLTDDNILQLIVISLQRSNDWHLEVKRHSCYRNSVIHSPGFFHSSTKVI